MSSSEKYWSDYIFRKAEDNGWIERGSQIMENPTNFGWITTSATRMEYLHEEIYTALTHSEPKLAFRALIQAKETMMRMENDREHHSLYDAFTTAMQRVEGLLTKTPLPKE